MTFALWIDDLNRSLESPARTEIYKWGEKALGRILSNFGQFFLFQSTEKVVKVLNNVYVKFLQHTFLENQSKINVKKNPEKKFFCTNTKIQLIVNKILRKKSPRNLCWCPSNPIHKNISKGKKNCWLKIYVLLLFSIKFFTWKIKEKYFEIFHFQNTRKKREEKFQRRKKCESKCASVFFQILEKLVNVVCCECVGPKVMFLYTFHVYFSLILVHEFLVFLLFFSTSKKKTQK